MMRWGWKALARQHQVLQMGALLPTTHDHIRTLVIIVLIAERERADDDDDDEELPAMGAKESKEVVSAPRNTPDRIKVTTSTGS